MPDKKIKFGIIGAGLMGREFASVCARWCHLTDMKAKPELVAVCDKNPGLYSWYEDNFSSITMITDDYHELLANPDVEAVYCAVPHNLHEQFYCDIIKAGKHLLGEKPFGIDKKANDDICKTDIDAIAVMTQPWLHAPQCIQVMESGKHVWSAVPLISMPSGSEMLEWCDKVVETSKRTGMHYFLAETSFYYPAAMYCRRQAAKGEFVYAEGKYAHD